MFGTRQGGREERALAGKHNISEIRLARSANRFKPQTADAEFILMNFGDRRGIHPSNGKSGESDACIKQGGCMEGRAWKEELGSGLLLQTKIADAQKFS